MYVNIVTLQSFYASLLGQRVQKAISVVLGRYQGGVTGERVIGLGYVIPYMEAFTDKAECCCAFMPARQGASLWPVSEAVATALVLEEELPLPDSSVDRIIMVHALEYTENAEETMRELWRVLVPGGYLVIVVANRRGFWAHSEFTPLGCGQPYSHTQLLSLLRRSGFFCCSVEETLHFLPCRNWHSGRISFFYEKSARRFFPCFGGVLVAEAQKQLYKSLPVVRHKSGRIFVPAFRPQQTMQQERPAVLPEQINSRFLFDHCMGIETGF